MRFFIIALIVLLNFIFQSTIAHYFSIFGAIPNTGLILIVSFALLNGKGTGALLGIVIGLLQDIVFCDVIGVHTLIYFIIGYTIGLTHEKLFRDSLVIPLFFTGLATLGFHMLYYLFMYFLGVDVSLTYTLRHIAFVEIIYNAILSLLIYKQVSRIYLVPYRQFGSRRRR